MTFRLQATSASGQVTSSNTYVVVDGIAPTGAVVSGPPPFTSSTTATISWTFADTGGSTTVTQLCQLDGGEKVPCTSPVTYAGLTPGEHTVIITIIDEAGNEIELERAFIVDTLPPTTEISLSPPPNANGWNTTDVVATLTATDLTGVQSVTYSLSGAQTGGATVPGASATITITASGTTTITYFATDVAGQVEPSKQVLVRIDKGAPTVAFTGTPTALGIPNTCITAVGGCTYSGTATDGLSGVAGVQLTFTGPGGSSFVEAATCTGCGAGATSVTWSYTPAPFQLLLGTYTVTARATDVAGNVGPTTPAPGTLGVI